MEKGIGFIGLLGLVRRIPFLILLDMCICDRCTAFIQITFE